METNNALIPVVSAVEAVDRPKIRDYNQTQVYNPLVVLIGRLYMLKGQQADTNDLRFQASELEEELRRSYGSLSLEEVRIALDNGVKKKYGEYYGLNVITYIDWIREYIRLERSKALEESRLRKLPPPHVDTPEEIEAKTKKGLAIRFDWWSTGNDLFYIPDPFDDYEYLKKRGLISPSNDQKAHAVEVAKEQLTNKARKAEKIRRGSVNTISNIINTYKESSIVESINKAAIINYAKCVIIAEYFQSLVDNNKSIQDIL